MGPRGLPGDGVPGEKVLTFTQNYTLPLGTELEKRFSFSAPEALKQLQRELRLRELRLREMRLREMRLREMRLRELRLRELRLREMRLRDSETQRDETQRAETQRLRDSER